MLAWIARLAGGISLSGWLLGALALAAAGYVATTQLVLNRRQAALDDAVAAGAQLTARNAALTGQIEQLQALNASNLRALAEMQADRQRDLADIQARAQRSEAAARDLADQKVRNAQDQDATAALADRCAALDRLFDRLHDGTGAAAPDRGQGRAGGGEAPGSPAGLPR